MYYRPDDYRLAIKNKEVIYYALVNYLPYNNLQAWLMNKLQIKHLKEVNKQIFIQIIATYNQKVNWFYLKKEITHINNLNRNINFAFSIKYPEYTLDDLIYKKYQTNEKGELID